MKILEMEQRSPEWFKARCGIPSASSFDKIITTTGKQSTQRKKYMLQLAGEVLSGSQEESYQNAAMLRGIELESEARSFYELTTGQSVKEVGCCIEDNNLYLASPDGLVGEDGLIEIKCPIMSTHVGYLLENELPSEYFQQVQGQLLVTGRKWVDFISYYPGIKPLLIRVKRDAGFISELISELRLFCKELDDIVNKLK